MYGFPLGLINVVLPGRAILAELGQATPECRRPLVEREISARSEKICFFCLTMTLGI